MLGTLIWSKLGSQLLSVIGFYPLSCGLSVVNTRSGGRLRKMASSRWNMDIKFWCLLLCLALKKPTPLFPLPWNFGLLFGLHSPSDNNKKEVGSAVKKPSLCVGTSGTKSSLFPHLVWFCEGDWESIEHLILFCPWVQEVWHSSPFHQSLPLQNCSRIEVWLFKVLAAFLVALVLGLLKLVAFLALFVGTFWKARNPWIFMAFPQSQAGCCQGSGGSFRVLVYSFVGFKSNFYSF